VGFDIPLCEKKKKKKWVYPSLEIKHFPSFGGVPSSIGITCKRSIPYLQVPFSANPIVLKKEFRSKAKDICLRPCFRFILLAHLICDIFFLIKLFYCFLFYYFLRFHNSMSYTPCIQRYFFSSMNIFFNRIFWTFFFLICQLIAISTKPLSRSNSISQVRMLFACTHF
jgi:hypothetical protein